MAGREYPQVLTLLNFVGARPTDTDILLVAGVWNKLGVFTVPDGVMFAVGRRFDGYVWMRLDSDGGGQVHGRARFKVATPTEDLKNPVLEFDSHGCGATPDIKQEKPFVMLSPPWAQSNSKIILEFFPDPILHAKPTAAVAADTIDLDDAQTELVLDCTYKVA